MGICLTLSTTAQTALKKVYNEDINPIEQIDQAVAKAKATGKFVVCQVGGNWCPWCLKFADFITKDTTISTVIADNFEYIHVNYNPRKSQDEEKLTQGKALMKRLNNAGRFGFPVFVVLDEDGKIRSYNYKTYGEHAYYLARHLSSAFKDINPGASVGLKMRNTPNWPLLFWAILMTGHPVLLIDARLEHANTENLLKQAKAEAIVVNEFDPYSVLSLKLNEIRKSPEVDTFAPKWADEAMFCSSGTTGDIKIKSAVDKFLAFFFAISDRHGLNISFAQYLLSYSI